MIFASPVGQRTLGLICGRFLHSLRSCGPAALCIAPSTPPPPSSVWFAAFTMASICRVVMSALMSCILVF